MNITAEEYRQQRPSHVDANAGVAVDPGKTTGIAIDYGADMIETHTTDFWGIIESVDDGHMKAYPWIVEAPYLTKWGKTQSPPIAYSSGRVAREAELLVEGLKSRGYDVIEHDPRHEGDSDWSGKWDDETARRIVGDWEGPSNSHTRDALKLLFFYGLL